MLKMLKNLTNVENAQKLTNVENAQKLQIL